MKGAWSFLNGYIQAGAYMHHVSFTSLLHYRKMVTIKKSMRTYLELHALRIAGYVGRKGMFSLDRPEDSIGQMSDARLLYYIAAYEDEYIKVKDRDIFNTHTIMETGRLVKA